MAQILTVEEALTSMKARTNAKGEIIVNRFNKRNFNTLMIALANDVDFKTEVAKMKKGEVVLEEIMPTKKFRKWCKKLVEKMGVDRTDSEVIMTDEFVIENMDGLYDFFTEAVYLYMTAGNRFDLPSRYGFTGGIYLKDIPEKKSVAETKNPQTHEVIGKYERTRKAHKELKVKSSCPSYLSSKRRV